MIVPKLRTPLRLKLHETCNLNSPYGVTTLGAFLTMQTKDLIKLLQNLIDEHEPYKSVMGEHEICMDVWERKNGTWVYTGFSPNIVVACSDDGVYPILVAKETNWADRNDAK